MNKLTIETDKNKLDISLIHHFITNSYWAKGRTIEEMQICIDNSLNFGIYLDNQQIGYARLITDYCYFAYIMDVFIVEQHRKKGYSKQLMEFILSFDSLKDIKIWRLATADAHQLYEKFGFTPLAKPENMMEIKQ